MQVRSTVCVCDVLVQERTDAGQVFAMYWCRRELMQVKLVLVCTPKALANASPGLLQPWDLGETQEENTESVRLAIGTLSELKRSVREHPGLKQPWARISQRLRRSTF